MKDDLAKVQDQYLLKVIKSLNRHIFVISENYDILAVTPGNTASEKQMAIEDIKYKKCYKTFFNEDRPCETCPAATAKVKDSSVLRRINNDGFRATCIYAYPMEDPETGDRTIVVLDFNLPTLDSRDEERTVSSVFLRNLISSAADGIIASDMTGKVIIFNKAATRITGYTKEEAMETLDIRSIYPLGDAKKIMKRLRSDNYGGKGVLRPYRQTCLRKDGTPVPISLTASIVYEGEKEIATIGFFHDLTETIRMEKELKQTQTQLLQAEKMSSLGKLSAGVAHQLNNPLGGITLFAQLMLEEHDLSEAAKMDIKQIKKEAERCKSIVKELLEFSRQTTKEVKLYNVNELIDRTLFLLKNQSIFQNIRIVREFAQDLPEVYADVQQMNHVFMNIILNAADAMEGNGTLTLSTSFEKKKNRVAIEISDTGTGLEEEILYNIFDPFFTTKEEGKGTGLGLSMAYGIVENHNGKLSAHNNENGGATFVIELPAPEDTNGAESAT